MRTSLFAGILVAALAAPAAADRAEDDLQLVKKAVGSSQVAQARPPAEEPLPPRAEAAPPARKGAPTWFRVRIVEKGNKRAKVSVNLPLGIVRALGDEWPIAERGRCRAGPALSHPRRGPARARLRAEPGRDRGRRGDRPRLGGVTPFAARETRPPSSRRRHRLCTLGDARAPFAPASD